MDDTQLDGNKHIYRSYANVKQAKWTIFFVIMCLMWSFSMSVIIFALDLFPDAIILSFIPLLFLLPIFFHMRYIMVRPDFEIWENHIIISKEGRLTKYDPIILPKNQIQHIEQYFHQFIIVTQDGKKFNIPELDLEMVDTNKLIEIFTHAGFIIVNVERPSPVVP